MKLTVKRTARKPTYTIGKMYIDGAYFCDTLEDVDRGLRQDMPLSEIKKIKVPDETAIPAGTYKVIVNVSPSKKRLLPRLLDVPGYEGILIHRGNTDKDTSGWQNFQIWLGRIFIWIVLGCIVFFSLKGSRESKRVISKRGA